MKNFICHVFNQVQLVHSPLPKSGAVARRRRRNEGLAAIVPGRPSPSPPSLATASTLAQVAALWQNSIAKSMLG
jgi:hypothetical protein